MKTCLILLDLSSSSVASPGRSTGHPIHKDKPVWAGFPFPSHMQQGYRLCSRLSWLPSLRPILKNVSFFIVSGRQIHSQGLHNNVSMKKRVLKLKKKNSAFYQIFLWLVSYVFFDQKVLTRKFQFHLPGLTGHHASQSVSVLQQLYTLLL